MIMKEIGLGVRVPSVPPPLDQPMVVQLFDRKAGRFLAPRRLP